MATTSRHNNKTTYKYSKLWGERKVKDLLYIKLSSILDLKLKDLAKLLLIMLIVIAVGLFSFNQFLDLVYKNQFLADPCSICRNINNNIIINWSNLTIIP